jgi:hypothetical protein
MSWVILSRQHDEELTEKPWAASSRRRLAVKHLEDLEGFLRALLRDSNVESAWAFLDTHLFHGDEEEAVNRLKDIVHSVSNYNDRGVHMPGRLEWVPRYYPEDYDSNHNSSYRSDDLPTSYAHDSDSRKAFAGVRLRRREP